MNRSICRHTVREEEVNSDMEAARPGRAERARRRAEARFRAAVEGRGGAVVGEYRGIRFWVAVRCGRGHLWHPTPRAVDLGACCPECSRLDAEESAFLAVVASRKGRIETPYADFDRPVWTRCSGEHLFEVRPRDLVEHGVWCPVCHCKSVRMKK